VIELGDSSIFSGFGHFNSDTLEVHADTLVSVVQSKSVENHEQNEYAGEGNSNPDDVGGGFNTLKDAEVDEDPGNNHTAEDLPLEHTGGAPLGLGVVRHAVIAQKVHDVAVEKSK